MAQGDTLDELNRDFSHEKLAQPVFLNSVPKCGTHLVRNVMRMFVDVEQHYAQVFIQHPILRQHGQAFSTSNPKLSWGHLLFSDDAAIALRQTRHIVMVRDPYTWVLARARFFLSDTFQGQLEHLKNNAVAVDELLNMMVFGIHGKAPTMRDIFENNALAWMGTKARIVRMEDLVDAVRGLDDSDASERFFSDLLGFCGIDMPDDWRDRVRVGADRKQSGTARENLAGEIDMVPDELPDMQKQLVDFVLPGVRSLLGYG